ncbi:ATP-binding cassette sub-family C member 10 [Euwallacea fornicatus]|uniref:ATP-binding cassette sub-family C member 10 n=1 Tax=Euwallacea fornicatus TaxID=995702 RepID=UPI00338DACC2
MTYIWNITNLCGDEGLDVWNTSRNDIGICFQQLFLDIPVLALLAIFSSYYLGRGGRLVVRGHPQLIAIRLRSLATVILAFLPLIQIYVFRYKTSENIPSIAYLLSAVQGLAWFIHFLFNLSLLKKFGKSPRGPIIICVLWSLIFVLTVISVRSHLLLLKNAPKPPYSFYLAYGMSLCYLTVLIFYAFSMILGEGETTYLSFVDTYTEIGETQPLLGNAYVRFREDGDPLYLGVAMENASWLSKLLFSWVEPLMRKGVQDQIKTSEDLYDLPVSLDCSSIGNQLDKTFSDQIKSIRPNTRNLSQESIQELQSIVDDVEVEKLDLTLLKALHKVFWKEFYSVGVLKLVADLAGFGGPMLLNRLINFIENKSENLYWGYLFAGSLLGTTLIGTLCDCHFNFIIAKVGFRMRSAIVTMIYKKTLSVNTSKLNSEFSVGQIVNFMSTDVDRIVNSCPSFHALWSIPFQLAVTLYLLYSQVGLAFLAGVVFSILLIPINKLIANKIGNLSTKLMEQKDKRVKIITEVLRGIKAVKLYVWEDHFFRQISRVRAQELKYLKGRKYLDALCVYFWATTPVVICILTFAVYVLMGNKLTAATVFTAVALLNMLISPLNAFPWVLNGMMEAWVSVKRIQKLLQLPDQDLVSYYISLQDQRFDIVLKDAGFNYGKELTAEEKLNLHGRNPQTSFKGKGGGKHKGAVKRIDEGGQSGNGDRFYLKNVNLKVKKGEFIGIMGPVGCGKSSILSCILAELSMHSGEISISQIDSGFGYVTQKAWLQRGTIRDNILFGTPFDEPKYKQVLFACGLVDDISNLPNGDFTVIGEGGDTLSGGQKTRVALARAVYQDKSVYLLDDILSAVDHNVAKHIFQNCILGLLKEKTKILCTHHVQFLIYADRILIIENGGIKRQGKPSEILPSFDDSLAIDLELGESMRSSHTSSLLESGFQSVEDQAKDSDSTLNVEMSATGSLNFSVYSSYWKAIGHLLCLSILLSVVLMQVSRNLTDWWLAEWVNNAEGNGTKNSSATTIVIGTPSDSQQFLKFYIGLAVVNTLFTLIRAFLFAYGGIVAAARFHKFLLKSVMKAKSTFFDITPLGRILNRFSSDTYTVDDSLPFILNILLAQFFGLLGSIGITVYGLPWICLFLVPLVPIYHWLQNYYRLTSRELKRITSVTLSPVYSHFNETLQGLTTINAMRANQRFRRENQDFMDANIKAQFASQAAVRWLGLRLQFIGVAIVAGVSFIAVIQHQYNMANPGFIGLAISYALSVTSLLSGVVNAFTETEREMIAVERVNQYINEIPLESTQHNSEPPFGWPSQGVVSFRDVSLRYREYLEPSIKLITFETRPSEKIGVVGRTGAGKTSIIRALFRLVEISKGEICIDSINITKISLSTLRSRLFCIPQDPFLFSGTMKENLDPIGEFRDNEIWNALAKVNLEATIKSLGGLNSIIEEGGTNLSAGQKQLICLARAVLHNAKILCIDEATANVDQETDRQIQLTLRSAFRKCTVLTIAHRIQTVLDSDRVLVIRDGEIQEFDTPENLLNDNNGYFYQMVNQES